MPSQLFDFTCLCTPICSIIFQQVKLGLDLKAIADYGVSPNLHISLDDATEAIAAAARLVACVADLVSGLS
jgi:hypothetical protein